jgi:hypothetical protein
MNDPDPSRSPPRVIPFMQGVLTVPGLAFLGVVLPIWVISQLSTSGVWPDILVGSLGVLAAGVAVGLSVRWWRPARWRAYGVLTALIAPPVLTFLFVVWFFASGGQIGPR